MCLQKGIKASMNSLSMLKDVLAACDAVIIGAGAGCSAAAGFSYTGHRFNQFFHDFGHQYGFNDMYTGGFYPYISSEEYWAYWSRYIWINRYMRAPLPVYDQLYELVSKKDYFVLTSNVDHCFQKAGFDKERLFYMQGDYGLLQCSKPCHKRTYDNEKIIRQMLEAQGFVIDSQGELKLPSGVTASMRVPIDLLPVCPKCKRLMTMNLRIDASFVEDEGWHRSVKRYSDFLAKHQNMKIVLLELGVGYNTPGIIKYPFWQLCESWPQTIYVCLNDGQASASDEIKDRSICINGDIGKLLSQLKWQ